MQYEKHCCSQQPTRTNLYRLAKKKKHISYFLHISPKTHSLQQTVLLSAWLNESARVSSQKKAHKTILDNLSLASTQAQNIASRNTMLFTLYTKIDLTESGRCEAAVTQHY